MPFHVANGASYYSIRRCGICCKHTTIFWSQPILTLVIQYLTNSVSGGVNILTYWKICSFSHLATIDRLVSSSLAIIEGWISIMFGHCLQVKPIWFPSWSARMYVFDECWKLNFFGVWSLFAVETYLVLFLIYWNSLSLFDKCWS